MSKKISAKALASLYPSNRWKTRSVINSAVSKVQQAYDEEFTRLQSVQQTYQSIMNFGKLATNAYGNFREAKLAGYDGNLKDYAMLDSQQQGVFKDKYKKLNSDVMEKTNNEMTLGDLYKSTTKNFRKKGRLNSFSKKINEQDIDTLLEWHEKSMQEAPGLSGRPAKPDIPISEDENFGNSNLEAIDELTILDNGLLTSKSIKKEEMEFESYFDNQDQNDKYWAKHQEYATNRNLDFNFENSEDRLKYMDRILNMPKEDRELIFGDMRKYDEEQARKKSRAELAEKEGVEYFPEFDEMYDVVESTRKSPGLQGLMQRVIPGGETGFEPTATFDLPYGGITSDNQYISKPTMPSTAVSEDENFGDFNTLYPDAEMGSIPSPSNNMQGPDVPIEFFREKSADVDYRFAPVERNFEISSTYGVPERTTVDRGLTPSVGGFMKQYQDSIRKRKELEELIR
tara:strand:+ start:312 stop:1679 length:1368 start_codon:yes stop_codon:yes gene_type:complete